MILVGSCEVGVGIRNYYTASPALLTDVSRF